MRKKSFVALLSLVSLLSSCRVRTTVIVKDDSSTVDTTKYSINLKLVSKKGIEDYKTINATDDGVVSFSAPTLSPTYEISGNDNLRVKYEYTFSYWIRLLNGKTENDIVNGLSSSDYEIINPGTYPFNSNMTLYGIFGDQKYNEVLFVNEDNSTILQDSLFVKDGDSVTYDNAIPTKSDDVNGTYSFSHWSTSSGKVYIDNSNIPVSEPTKFKANYMNNTNNYRVVFKTKGNNGFDAVSVQFVSKNSKITTDTIPNGYVFYSTDSDGLKTKTAQTFDKWITLKDGKTENDWDSLTSSDYEEFDTSSDTVTSNIILYAKDSTYYISHQIVFCNDDGTILEDSYVQDGELATYKGTKPIGTSGTGSNFKGWKTKDGVAISLSSLIVKKPYKLFANYDDVCFDIKFVDNSNGNLIGTVSKVNNTVITKDYLETLLDDYWDDEEKEIVNYFDIIDAPTTKEALVSDKTYHVNVTSISYDKNGVFPQTKVTDSELINKIKNGGDGIRPTSESYYTKVDGKYYYKDESGVDTVYRKVEPIKWIILAGDFKTGATLISEKVLTYRKFFDYDEAGLANKETRVIDGKQVYHNNYKESDIRAWLNDSFISDSFADSSSLQEKEIDNSLNSCANGSGDNPNKGYDEFSERYICDNTVDKVWLLSVHEVYNTVETTYDLFPKCEINNTSTLVSRKAYDVDGNSARWYLRTPKSAADEFFCFYAKVANLNDDGRIGGEDCMLEAGIRPVIQFKL